MWLEIKDGTKNAEIKICVWAIKWDNDSRGFKNILGDAVEWEVPFEDVQYRGPNEKCVGIASSNQAVDIPCQHDGSSYTYRIACEFYNQEKEFS